MSRGEHPRRRRSDSAPPPKGILAGERELIFQYLPEEVRANMLRRGSESAALWNAFYPFAHSGLSLRAWLSLPRLWGSSAEGSDDDQLMPCFWGLTVDGQPLGGLAESASDVAGREDRLEIDLFLVGRRHLVAVEAKIDGAPGRCGRYDSGRCPEVHGPDAACRYWEDGPASFEAALDFGIRPVRDQEEPPPCAIHYQMARTLLGVENLARRKDLVPHLTLLMPQRRWPALRGGWQDFAERVRDEEQWRRLRVMAWEDLEGLKRS